MNISEIANLAGVSPAAVSRYLNHGYISEEKKAIIQKVIEETGYIPSQQAQTLRTRKTKVIGVILPKIDSESISRITAGISQELSGTDYQLLLANTENNIEKEFSYLNTFRQNYVDGIILIATLLSPKHKKIIQSLQIPVVILGQRADYVSCIYHDDYHASYDLASLLIGKGYKNIGYIGVTRSDIAVGKGRQDGFTDCLLANHLPVPPEHFSFGPFTMENGFLSAKALLQKNPSLDALFCATDTIALGAIKYLHESGKKVPEDIAITGFGHNKTGSILLPPLTSVHYYYKTSGIEGARLLLERLSNEKTPLKSTMLGYQIVAGGSI